MAVELLSGQNKNTYTKAHVIIISYRKNSVAYPAKGFSPEKFL